MTSVQGFGKRIEGAMLRLSARLGSRVTLKAFGELVAKAEGRKKPYGPSTVKDWIDERNEPTLAVFRALSRATGEPVALLAFGDDGLPPAELSPRKTGEQAAVKQARKA